MMENEANWSEAVEDLVDGGDVDGAISLLESTVSKLEALSSSSTDLKLSSALSDLANLYSSRGFSTESDELRTRAFLIQQRAQRIQPPDVRVSESVDKKDSENASVGCVASSCNDSTSSDDDWEAVADRGSIELFSVQTHEEISRLSLEDSQQNTPKRRGRGSFLYKKNGLYSDHQSNAIVDDDSDDEANHPNPEKGTEKQNSRYGTNHVLVVADFPPSMTTTDLEKLFESFRDRGVVIRWVNDTVALAVFRTPSIALEAHNSIQCPFRVRILSEDDSLRSSISSRDLEPPVPRPKTSVRTAERLIAQGMGRKLTRTTFGSEELRKQEEARRNRIVTRQVLRDDAWGADD